MDDPVSLEDKAKSILEDYNPERPKISFLHIAGLILLFVFIVSVIPKCASGSSTGTECVASQVIYPHRLLSINADEHAIAQGVLYVKKGVGNLDDLFYCAAQQQQTCINLTSSPNINEMMPVVNHAGTHIAYYAETSGKVDVYLLELPNGAGIPLTSYAGDSGLHTNYVITTTLEITFSQDDSRVIFPVMATESSAIEIFLAYTDGKQVEQVTDIGSTVISFVWTNPETIVAMTQREDGALQIWRLLYTNGIFQLEEF